MHALKVVAFDGKFSNILLVQLGDIGDVVLTMPTIQAVKRAYPDARLSVLVRKPFGSLLRASSDVYEIVESEKFLGSFMQILNRYAVFVHRLRQAHYDLVIDLRTGDRGAIFTLLTGAPVRVGRNVSNKKFLRGLIYTKIVSDPQPNLPDIHPGANQSLHIAREIGIIADDSIPKLAVGHLDSARALELLLNIGLTTNSQWISISPCSRWKYKEWGYEKWSELIDLLWVSFQLPAVLVGSPEEAITCQKIVAGRNGRAFNLAGKTTLGELAALLQWSAIHIGVDSAAPHIAAAVGRPTVTIFGPSNWREWVAIDDFHRIVTSRLPCVPCGQMGCENMGKSSCLDTLEVREVFEQTKKVWKRIKGICNNEPLSDVSGASCQPVSNSYLGVGRRTL